MTNESVRRRCGRWEGIYWYTAAVARHFETRETLQHGFIIFKFQC